MPSKAKKSLIAFLEDIPDGKLHDIPENQHTIAKDTNWRLDMQNVCLSRLYRDCPHA